MRQTKMFAVLSAIALVVTGTVGEAADKAAELSAKDLVGSWQVDAEATIQRAVDMSPANEKAQVRQELSTLLPKQTFTFDEDGTYSVITSSVRGNASDRGKFSLVGGKLTLVSGGLGGTRTLGLTPENKTLILGEQLILTRVDLTNRPSPATRENASSTRSQVDQAASAAQLSRSGHIMTSLAGKKGDKTLSSTVSKSDRITGFTFELNEHGEISDVRSISQQSRKPKEGLNLKVLNSRDGYVLSGIKVEAGDKITAIRLVCSRLKSDGMLDGQDSYESEWVGSAVNKNIITLGCNGQTVGGFMRSTKDGVLCGISLRMKPSFPDETENGANVSNPPATRENTTASPHPLVAMLRDLSAALQPVKDKATAQEALTQIGLLKAQYQGKGMGKSEPAGIQPLMRRVQDKVRAIQQILPDEGRQIEAASRDLLMSIATPQERAANSEASNRISSALKLKQVATAIIQYEAKIGFFPLKIDDLIKSNFITPEELDSPMGDAAGGDFVYIRPTGRSVRKAIVYDAAALKAGQGTNVAFVDGSVEWVKPEMLSDLGIPKKN